MTIPDATASPDVTAEDVGRRLQVALALTHGAGQITLRYFQQPLLNIERKSDDSPVTIADREAESYLRGGILAAFPKDGVLGEELGEVEGSSGFRWVIDPIDGTKTFISGVPLYTTLLGLLWNGVSVAGVILAPAVDECVYAARGTGAYWRQGNRERPACVSDRRALRDAIFVTSQVDSFERRQSAAVFQNLQSAAFVTRTWGDGYGYLLVATGRADLMLDPVMNLWDAAAILPVLEEAGGCFTDWQGNPTVHSGEGLATNKHLLAEVLTITRPHAKLSL